MANLGFAEGFSARNSDKIARWVVNSSAPSRTVIPLLFLLQKRFLSRLRFLPTEALNPFGMELEAENLVLPFAARMKKIYCSIPPIIEVCLDLNLSTCSHRQKMLARAADRPQGYLTSNQEQEANDVERVESKYGIDFI